MPKFLTNEFITRTLEIYGVNATPSLCASIRTYIELLLRWNQKIALTTITDPAEILRFHFGESMFAARQVPIRHGRLADVGTGPGFPAVPISMVIPELHCVLIESNQKKAAFLAELVRTLKIDGIEIYRGRMESFTDSAVRFDFSVSRALGMHNDFLSWSSRHLAPSGTVVLWIGDDDACRISSMSEWDWNPTLPIPDSRRRMLLFGSTTKKD